MFDRDFSLFLALTFALQQNTVGNCELVPIFFNVIIAFETANIALMRYDSMQLLYLASFAN